MDFGGYLLDDDGFLEDMILEYINGDTNIVETCEYTNGIKDILEHFLTIFYDCCSSSKLGDDGKELLKKVIGYHMAHRKFIEHNDKLETIASTIHKEIPYCTHFSYMEHCLQIPRPWVWLITSYMYRVTFRQAFGKGIDTYMLEYGAGVSCGWLPIEVRLEVDEKELKSIFCNMWTKAIAIWSSEFGISEENTNKLLAEL